MPDYPDKILPFDRAAIIDRLHSILRDPELRAKVLVSGENFNKVLMEAGRFRDCRTVNRVYECPDCGHKFKMIFSCNSRICPDCARRYGFLVKDSVRKVIRGLVANKRRGWLLGFLTLTIDSKRFGGGFPSAYQVKKAYHQAGQFLRLYYSKYKCHVGRNGKIVSSKKWRGAGAVSVMQFGEAGNLHFHCLIYGPYISQKTLSAAWGKITGDSFIVDIRAAQERKDRSGQNRAGYIINYIMRYICRPPDNEGYIDLAMLTLLQKGLRRVRTFGVLYNRIKKRKRPRERLDCLCCGNALKFFGLHRDSQNRLLEYIVLKKYVDKDTGTFLRFYGREDILWQPQNEMAEAV